MLIILYVHILIHWTDLLHSKSTSRLLLENDFLNETVS